MSYIFKPPVLPKEDINQLVDIFQEFVRRGNLQSSIPDLNFREQWPVYSSRMIGLWKSVLIQVKHADSSPFILYPGSREIDPEFEPWQDMLFQAVSTYFCADKATQAEWLVRKMAHMLISLLKYYKTAA